MKHFISELLHAVISENYQITSGDIEKDIKVPPDSKLGDYAFPCFVLSKNLRKNPQVIADELKQLILQEGKKEWLSGVQSIGGYLNFYLNREFLVSKILEEAKKENYGGSSIGKGKTICMDYSSPNIAKKFHVGHLRTTVIGNSLYKIFSKQGYKVIRINHLGDWGTQFGKLIVGYKLWSGEKEVEEKGIEELLRIYVKFGEEAEQNQALYEEAREWFAKMEQGDEEALTIWKWFKEISLKEYEKVYEILNISFDSYHGERFYLNQIPELVEELKDKKLLEESEGANIISLENYGMPPCLITKKDGSSIYHSRDIAAARYRKKTYDFSQCLYVTGMEQKLHFTQVFKALELMGNDWASKCHHIPYGLVRMEGKKLSSRKGTVVYAEDILIESISRAKKTIQEKNPKLPDLESVARKIGVGAVIFHDLSNQLCKDDSFCWEDVLNFDGMTAPYIQYTYARANSILRKTGVPDTMIEVEVLTDDISYELLKHISQYPEAIKNASEKYEPCMIARYVYNLAVLFNKFYQECRIVNEECKVKEARALLTYFVQKLIGDAMGLLGIECPEEM